MFAMKTTRPFGVKHNDLWIDLRLGWETQCLFFLPMRTISCNLLKASWLTKMTIKPWC